MARLVVGTLVWGVLSLAAALPTAAPAVECTREKLLAAADAYVAAQTAGQPSSLQKLLAANFTYMQDNKAVADLASGVLSKALHIDSRRSTADTEACASYTELIATGPVPYVIGTQIRHLPANDSLHISLIDTVAATTGDLFFNSSATLAYARNESWTAMPASANRTSRAALRAAIDGYLDMWSDPHAAAAMPFGDPCERIEGGRYVSACTLGVPKVNATTAATTKPNSMRRYVIDEVLGSADVLCAFTAIADIPDSHELRMENGRIRYVHTITGAWKSGS